MADPLNMSGLAAGAAKMGANVYDMGVWLFLLVALAALIGMIAWYVSFKHHVVIRLKTKNGKRIVRCMAKTRTRHGVTWWRIRELRRDVTPPPSEAIEVLRNGRLYAECYWSEDNPEPVWLKDTNDQDTSFEPFTTQERSLHVEGITKAMQRKKKNIWEVIQTLATPIALIIIIVVVFAFWGEMTAPTIEIARQNGVTASQNARIAEQNARIMAVMMGQLDVSQLNISATYNIPTNGG